MWLRHKPLPPPLSGSSAAMKDGGWKEEEEEEQFARLLSSSAGTKRLTPLFTTNKLRSSTKSPAISSSLFYSASSSFTGSGGLYHEGIFFLRLKALFVGSK